MTIHQPRHGRPSTRTGSRAPRLTPTPATRSEPTQHQQTKMFSVRSTQCADASMRSMRATKGNHHDGRLDTDACDLINQVPSKAEQRLTSARWSVCFARCCHRTVNPKPPWNCLSATLAHFRFPTVEQPFLDSSAHNTSLPPPVLTGGFGVG